MREMVVHGVVGVLTNSQVAERSDGLREALGRMSVARSRRDYESAYDAALHVPAESGIDSALFDADARSRRSALLQFSRRAREGVGQDFDV